MRFSLLPRRRRGAEPSEAKEPDFGERPQYLQDYVSKVSGELGEPVYMEKLDSSLKKQRTYNVVYPVGGGVFIHAYSVKGSDMGKYVVIEPPRPSPELMRTIDVALANVISGEAPESAEERKRLLLSLLDRILEPTDSDVDYSSLANDIELRRVPVKREWADYVKYHVIRDKIGVGVLEPFLRDPYLEDISASGVGNIYIVHKIFNRMESNVGFSSEDELDAFVLRLSEKIGKPITRARPIVDATLPDGSRLNIVFGSDVSLRGTNFTIRKASKVPISVTQLIDWGTIDERVAAYAWMLLREGMSGFICGETASGKTTALNAIAVFIRPTYKVVTIEDTAEVQLPHPNWTRELARDTGRPETSVALFDLLRAALRQRPDYIIVGEIRGAEGAVAFQAMQTGHPVLSTFHAGDFTRLIQRLTGHPIDIPKPYLDNLNFAWFQASTYSKTGLLVRRMTALYEIVGYDPNTDSVSAIPVFTWDPSTDRFIFSGRGSSYLLEEKIARMRGLPRRDYRLIYDELDMRAAFLRELVNRKVFDYFQVFKAVVKAESLGVERALAELRAGRLELS
ncbi:MAG: Type IV secretory pathway, VirB11 component, and related ATPase involved in archaeal flagella biosynthesis [uncultured Acidilobus sp. CIS]|nr:MAG: Type IV secretory pathway, VirB11 component, and related ATPase involved in archaeal flagella biosynthesis [uncultured Acidilobus sp. CIS]